MNLKKSNNVAVLKIGKPQEEEQREGDLRFSLELRISRSLRSTGYT